MCHEPLSVHPGSNERSEPSGVCVVIEPAPLQEPASGLPETRRAILERLKRDGDVGAEPLAAALGITTTGTRQHLSALERDDLVTRLAQRSGRGRPKYVYSLTPTGDALFPRTYAELTNELLQYVKDEDPELVTRIFDRRAHRRLEDAQRRLNGLSLAEKVSVLARILDEDGYLADFVQNEDGSWSITEHNCAVLSVAQRYAHACGSELQFLQAALPEATVVRTAHRLAGGHVCSYDIRGLADDEVEA